MPIPPYADAINKGHAFSLSNIIAIYISYFISIFSTIYTVLHILPSYPLYFVTNISFNIFLAVSLTFSTVSNIYTPPYNPDYLKLPLPLPPECIYAFNT